MKIIILNLNLVRKFIFIFCLKKTKILKLLIIHKYRYICCMYLFFRFLAFCIRYCRCTKIRGNRISRWFDQRCAFYVVFLLYRLVCKSRFDASTLFFNPLLYTSDTTTCFFFIRISETQQLFSHRLSPSIYLWLELFFFIHLSLFCALWIFSRKLMEGTAIPAMLMLQEIDIFNKKKLRSYVTWFSHLFNRFRILASQVIAAKKNSADCFCIEQTAWET